MRVVVEVAAAVAEPQTVSADRVPADGENRARCTGEDRRAERRKDVVPVMPAARHVPAERTERVHERRRSVDREDMTARRLQGRGYRRWLPNRRKRRIRLRRRLAVRL